MKIYYDYFRTEFEVHDEDSCNYYHYEKVEGEYLKFKFPKKDCKTVGTSKYYCSQCGKRLGGNYGCRACQPDSHIYSKPEHWIEKYLREEKMSWQEFFKQQKRDNYSHHFHCCHNCKFFMYHPLRYCPKCGTKFVTEDLKYTEFLAKYPSYKAGY